MGDDWFTRIDECSITAMRHRAEPSGSKDRPSWIRPVAQTGPTWPHRVHPDEQSARIPPTGLVKALWTVVSRVRAAVSCRQRWYSDTVPTRPGGSPRSDRSGRVKGETSVLRTDDPRQASIVAPAGSFSTAARTFPFAVFAPALDRRAVAALRMT